MNSENGNVGDRDEIYFSKLSSLNRNFHQTVSNFMAQSTEYDFTCVCEEYIAYSQKLKKQYPVLLMVEPIETISKRPPTPEKTTIPAITPAITPAFKSSPITTVVTKPLTEKISPPSISPLQKLVKTNEPPVRPLDQTNVNFSFKPNLTSSPADTTAKIIEPTFKPISSFKQLTSNPIQQENKPSSSFQPSTLGPSTSTSSSSFKPLPLSEMFKPPTSTGLPMGFSFTPVQHQQPSTSTSTNEENGNAEEDHMPLDPQQEAFVESEALYSIKCKLFYKDKGKFVEYGLGMIYIKKTEDEKTQLLMRANNANATILLNIHLSKSLPIIENDKGALITCVPNPPIEKITDETVCFFIRVKNKQMASELYSNLTKYQQ